MWKEWTSKIKNFAEDIASPDYDDDHQYDDSRSHDEHEHCVQVAEGTRPPVDKEHHVHKKNTAEVTQATTSGQNTRGAVGGNGANASMLGDTAAWYPAAGSHLDAVAKPQAAVVTSKRSAVTKVNDLSDNDPLIDALTSCGETQVGSSSATQPLGPPQAKETLQPSLAPLSSLELKPHSFLAASTPLSAPTKCAKSPLSAPAVTTSLSAPSMEQQHPREQPQLIPSFETEKARLLRDIGVYQEEVRAAHERTVQYYEEKRKAVGETTTAATALESTYTRDKDTQEQIRDLRVALQTASSELETERTLKEELQVRVEKLEEEAKGLRASLAAAREEVGAMAASSATAATPVRALSEPKNSMSPPGVAHGCQRYDDELDTLQKVLKEKDALLAEQAAQLESSMTACRTLETQLEEEQSRRAMLVTVSSQTNSVVQHQRESVAAKITDQETNSSSVPSNIGEVIISNSISAVTAPTEGEPLQKEVKRLTETISRLQSALDTQEREHSAAVTAAQVTHAEAERKFREQLNAVERRMAENSRLYNDDLLELKMRLETEQNKLKFLDAEKKIEENARDAAEQRCTDTQAALTALEQKLKKLEEENQKRVQESDKKQGDSSISVTVLTQVKKELGERVEAMELMMGQLRRMAVDTLVRLGVDMQHVIQETDKQNNSEQHSHCSDDADGNNSDAEETRRWVDMSTEMPLPQLFSLLITECLRQHNVVLRAERVQEEWEQTYEQARLVNESLNRQVSDAWGTIGKMREEMSIKDEAVRHMQSRVGSGDARLVEMQEQLAGVMHELQSLREEREGWVERWRQAETGAEIQATTLTSLEEELRVHQEMLRMKDAELQASLQSTDNLQLVLDRFQESKLHEVEALTLAAQVEAEELRKKLAEAQRVIERHDSEWKANHQSFERQIALKDAEVTTMHRKLAEVRKALEKTTSRHMGGSEASIDKGVVSQLLAKYIHAFIEQRKEAEDMLKVLSGLLDWDEATQEVAGLLPGPNNPQLPGGSSGQGTRSRKPLLSWIRKSEKTSASQSSTKHTNVEAQTGKAGLVSMWVQFLLKESEEGNVQTPANHHKDDVTVSPLTAPAPYSVGVSQPNSSSNAPPLPASVAMESPNSGTKNQAI